MTKWARWGSVLLLTGVYGIGESGSAKESVLPVRGYVRPETVETEPVPWLYNQFGSESLQGATVFRKEDYYTEYRNGNQQITRVGDVYYETGDQFDCRIYPLSKPDLLFYEPCGDLFDSIYKIIDFNKKRVFGIYGYFLFRSSNIFYLASGYWRDGGTETYPFQYPRIIALNITKNTMTTYKFGKPDKKFIEEAVRCNDGKGGTLLRSTLVPTGDIVENRMLIMALPYFRQNEGLRYTPNCRLRFVFDIKTKTGRYFLI